MAKTIAAAAGTAAALWMLTFTPAILAQQAATVGELIDKGGKKIAREDLVKLLSGASARGISFTNPGWYVETSYKSDGSVDGLVTAAQGGGRGTQFWGKWSVGEQGEICIDTNTVSAGKFQSCTPYFVLGGTYYQAAKDDKSAPVHVREIRR